MKTSLFSRQCAAVQSLLCTMALGFLTSAPLRAELIEDDVQLNQKVDYPNVIVEPIEAVSLMEFESQDVKTVQANLIQLEKSIEKYSQKTFVPYIWGGNRVGSIAECNSCVACLHKKTTENMIVGDSVQASSNSCESCERCGIDCSNLAHQVFTEAKLDFPYLTSRTMAGDEQNHLEDKYNLVNVGHDLRQAKFGDLIVQETHVVIFLGFASDDLSEVSYLHSSRRGEDERPFGGINVVRGRSRESLQKTVVRILRHRQLLDSQVYSDRIVTNDRSKPFVN